MAADHLHQSTALTRLIAEAGVLAGGTHPCNVLGHKRVFRGGRSCGCEGTDADGYRWTGACSMPVYECEACGDCDYGDNDETRERLAACATSEVMLYA